MANLGELFSAARQQRGLPVDEVARRTRIRADYIAALEQNQFQLLPGDVYARGFVRNYAMFLGIPTDDAIAAYEETAAPPKRRGFMAPSAPSRREPDPIRIEPLSPTPIDTRLRYAPSIWLVSLFALVAVIVVYLGYNISRGSIGPIATPTLLPATPTQLDHPVVIVSNTPVLTPWPTPDSSNNAGSGGTTANPTATVVAQVTQPGAVATATQPGVATGATPTNGPPAGSATPVVPGLTPTAGTGVMVDITIQSSRADAWVRVVADGKVILQQTLAHGSTRTVAGQQTVCIRTGRADLVRIKANGVDKGLMGSSNQLTVNKQWDNAGNETVVSTC